MTHHGSQPTPETPLPSPCEDAECAPGSSIESLNETCYCIAVDQANVQSSLRKEYGEIFSQQMWETHPHLFAASPFFVGEVALQQMAGVVSAIEAVVRTRAFEDTVMRWAPPIAEFDSGTLGGILGYDFHLTDAGPRLIEINTNPGGAFLNAVLARCQRRCCLDEQGFATAPVGVDAERSLLETFFAEWRLQRGDMPLGTVAIVDDRPERQYLYPELLLVRELMSRRGLGAVVCDPRELSLREGRLCLGDTPIDLVYNRLTDFALAEPDHAPIKDAYVSGKVVLTPHPRAHALYADKRNLTLLCDRAFLEQAGVSETEVAMLTAAVPHTTLVASEDKEKLWSRRRGLFFKPATGYGSRAAYRGDKLTKRVWGEILDLPYVAQEIVMPSERWVGPAAEQMLKADVRIYSYAGDTKLVAARMYQGQTTNLRTPGGGFAPVLTRRPGYDDPS